jgi:hypothetical protein
MTDETKQLSTPQRSRTRRFDAPLFSRSAQEADASDMLSLIQDTAAAELEDPAPEPTDPPAKKLKQSAEDAGRAEPPQTGSDFLRDYLRGLNWSESDIARIVVGPELSHYTAEGLFRQHAANTAQDQALLMDALKRAGASKIPRDPSLLSGLNPSHLLPDQPADLTQIVSQFAQLPEVQKRRFLALLDEQPASKASSAATSGVPRKPLSESKAGTGKPSQKAPLPQAEPAAKKEATSKGEDVLTTVLKGSFDTLGIIIKGLLGDGRSGKSLPPSPKSSTPPDKKTPPADEEEQTPPREESSESQPEEDTSDPSSEESEDSGTSDDDINSDSDNTTYGPPAPDDLPTDIGGDREPD